MHTNLRFVFTGGPGAGKTTVLELLSSKGYVCKAEVARKIIQARIQSGLSPRPSAPQFAQEVLNDDINQYDSHRDSKMPIFFDRGIGDALWMQFQCKAITRMTAIEQLTERPYSNHIFYFPPWEKIYTTDTERDQTYAEAVEVATSLKSWYENLGYSIITIPLTPPEQRVEFILQSILHHDSMNL